MPSRDLQLIFKLRDDFTALYLQCKSLCAPQDGGPAPMSPTCQADDYHDTERDVRHKFSGLSDRMLDVMLQVLELSIIQTSDKENQHSSCGTETARDANDQLPSRSNSSKRKRGIPKRTTPLCNSGQISKFIVPAGRNVAQPGHDAKDGPLREADMKVSKLCDASVQTIQSFSNKPTSDPMMKSNKSPIIIDLIDSHSDSSFTSDAQDGLQTPGSGFQDVAKFLRITQDWFLNNRPAPPPPTSKTSSESSEWQEINCLKVCNLSASQKWDVYNFFTTHRNQFKPDLIKRRLMDKYHLNRGQVDYLITSGKQQEANRRNDESTPRVPKAKAKAFVKLTESWLADFRRPPSASESQAEGGPEDLTRDERRDIYHFYLKHKDLYSDYLIGKRIEKKYSSLAGREGAVRRILRQEGAAAKSQFQNKL